MRASILAQLAIVGATAGCAASTVTQASAANTPSLAVEQFMLAASDSNLTRMSELWGTEKGPAASTGEPKEFGRRMVIMQTYLRGVTVRTLGEVSTTRSDRTLVTTELSRGPCKVTLPVTTVRAGNRWIVNQFDLAQAGTVNKPCEGSGTPSGNPGQ